jgi:hypothetical protein
MNIVRMEYYIYILVCIIIILVIATFYFRYIRETFEDVSGATNIDNTYVQEKIITPLLAGNPDLSGVFNTPSGPGISEEDKTLLSNSLSNTSIPQNTKNPYTDNEKKCEILREHYKGLKDSLPMYIATLSQSSIISVKKQLAEQEIQMSNIGC